MENELERFQANEPRKLRAGESSKDTLTKEYDELKQKLDELKIEYCNNDNIFGTDDVEG